MPDPTEPIPSSGHHGEVPRISFFCGIAIMMYFYDHEPPHFHAQYAEYHAVIAINVGEVLVGDLPSRAQTRRRVGRSAPRRTRSRLGAREKVAAPPTVDPLP